MTTGPLWTALLVIIGILLLMPGGCVIAWVNANGLPVSAGSPFTVEAVYAFWAICFAISALGLCLILRAIWSYLEG